MINVIPKNESSLFKFFQGVSFLRDLHILQQKKIATKAGNANITVSHCTYPI
jgi:hypothetical protein